MARKIVKPVCSRLREIKEESYPRKVSSLTTVSVFEPRMKRKLRLCAQRTHAMQCWYR